MCYYKEVEIPAFWWMRVEQKIRSHSDSNRLRHPCNNKEALILDKFCKRINDEFFAIRYYRFNNPININFVIKILKDI